MHEFVINVLNGLAGVAIAFSFIAGGFAGCFHFIDRDVEANSRFPWRWVTFLFFWLCLWVVIISGMIALDI